MGKSYIAIDLKSFYASVECIKRKLDPLDTNLVVADLSRTEKTICLAVSPTMKSYGLSGRARLFEVIQKMREVNAERLYEADGRHEAEESYIFSELQKNKGLRAGFIIAPPCMADYVYWSTRIYDIYLKYIAPEDIHVYSIDEVFIDATQYLSVYKMSAKELAMTIILDVLNETGITATAGIGTNLYLCKIAMDIMAKRIPADKNGVRIAMLDEMEYRKQLWEHRPLTDFWRVGKGYAKRLEENGLYTMGDIARCSVGKPDAYYNEDFLYKLFGVNAELLIDHAWGWEPCTMKEIKAYRPETRCVCAGQVLHTPYTKAEAEIVVREMAEAQVLELVDKKLVSDQFVLTVGYDVQNLKDEAIRKKYRGEIKLDAIGRQIPKHAHGTVSLKSHTSSAKKIVTEILALYRKIVNEDLLIRRIQISANRLMEETALGSIPQYEQLSFFQDTSEALRVEQAENKALERERSVQEAVLSIKKRFGKNAILKGTNFKKGATGRDRNKQIGGHKA